MPVHYDCPACGDSHPSRLAVADRMQFCSLVIKELRETCPVTREEVSLTHWNLFWRDALEVKRDRREGGFPVLQVAPVERRRAPRRIPLLKRPR